MPSPGQHTLPWTCRFDPVFGRSLPAAIVFAVLALLAAVAGFLLGRSVREPNPPYPLMYAPPEGMGPAQGAYLLTERINDEMYAATLLQMGDRGMATIERTPSGWTLLGANGDGRLVDEVDRPRPPPMLGVGRAGRSPPTDAVAAGKQMQGARQLRRRRRGWARQNGLITTAGLGASAGSGVLAVLLASFLGFVWNPLSMSVLALIPGCSRSFACRCSAGRGHERTRSRSRAVVAHRWLPPDAGHAVGRGPLRLLRPQGALHGVHPLGGGVRLRRQWAEKYRIETGEEPPLPSTTPALRGCYGAAASSAMSTTSPPPSARRSPPTRPPRARRRGGGGGGFSGGGGGGGGGGGSW